MVCVKPVTYRCVGCGIVMRLCEAVAFTGLIALSPMAAPADDVKETRMPSDSENEMFDRFVKECVAITPGTGRFPGSFVMGEASPRANERAAVEVTMSDSFRISKYELTQELYLAVTKRNPSRWKGPRNSVENISWRDAVRFCELLTAILRNRNLIKDSEEVRLPTAAEWEYCCRARYDGALQFRRQGC